MMPFCGYNGSERLVSARTTANARNTVKIIAAKPTSYSKFHRATPSKVLWCNNNSSRWCLLELPMAETQPNTDRRYSAKIARRPAQNVTRTHNIMYTAAAAIIWPAFTANSSHNHVCFRAATDTGSGTFCTLANAGSHDRCSSIFVFACFRPHIV